MYTADAPQGAQVILENGPWHLDGGSCCDVNYRDADGDGRVEALLSADTTDVYVWPSDLISDIRSPIRLGLQNTVGPLDGPPLGFGDFDGDGSFDVLTYHYMRLVPEFLDEVTDFSSAEGREVFTTPAIMLGDGSGVPALGLQSDDLDSGIVWPFPNWRDWRESSYASLSFVPSVSPDRDGDGTDDILIIGCCALTEEQSADPNYLPLGVVVYGADLFPPETQAR